MSILFASELSLDSFRDNYRWWTSPLSKDEPKTSMPRANFPSGYELLQIGCRNIKPKAFTVLDSEKLNDILTVSMFG